MVLFNDDRERGSGLPGAAAFVKQYPWDGSMTDLYPERYLEGIRLFNAGEFFACHDVLEELWSETTGPEKAFYQGLIQAAVALFHFGEGNLGGARKMYLSARRYLLPYAPSYMGLDVARFLNELRGCFKELLEATGDYPFHITLPAERLPKLCLTDNSAGGEERPSC